MTMENCCDFDGCLWRPSFHTQIVYGIGNADYKAGHMCMDACISMHFQSFKRNVFTPVLCKLLVYSQGRNFLNILVMDLYILSNE